MVKMDEMPADEISIHPIHAGDGDGADIIFDFNGQLMAYLSSLVPKYSTSMSVPQFLGYVVHADTGRVIGFLRQWVSGRRLKDVNVLATSAERR